MTATSLPTESAWSFPAATGTVATPILSLTDAAPAAPALFDIPKPAKGADAADDLRDAAFTRVGIDVSARVGPGTAGPMLPIATTASAPTPPATHIAPPELASHVAEVSVKAVPEQALPGAAAPGSGAMPAPFAGQGAAIPQHIAQHIAANLPKPISDLGNGTLELALDPPELGRVRMSLVEIGGTLTLSITADRPETAELMRRHMDILTQEFSRSGLDAPNVRVGTGAEGQGAPPDRNGEGQSGPTPLPEAETAVDLSSPGAPHDKPVDPTRALDLRL